MQKHWSDTDYTDAKSSIFDLVCLPPVVFLMIMLKVDFSCLNMKKRTVVLHLFIVPHQSELW